MDNLLQVGAITSPHGVRGEVKVFPTTDDPARFKKLKQVFLDTGKELQELEITQVKFFKNLVILRFAQFNNRDQVEAYKGKALYVTRENAVELEEDEYFIADLIGIQVQSDTGEILGTLSDVLQTGANDVYVIKSEQNKELLIPAIHECIKSVDIENQQMTVHLLEGLRELNEKK